ncbi:LOW QUALITY PROTEIN: hypothetical protein Cgig2_014307 [Carnegiea gigantea]|uniref:Uncharacterized protein n=1 Tax=Carnegiea gigantea TaxID=171969 RepID=A0A9Q1GKT6_9CARY|nr:LOW QUALITY PROTEIN: hypothetical protein Cgig2_014307 [Carnegiea gigantea]
MSPKGLRQLIKNLNDKQKEDIREIFFGGFLHLQADIIPEKMCGWSGTFTHVFAPYHLRFCSLPLTNGAMKVTEHDVHVMLDLPTGSLEVVEPKNEINMTVEFISLLNHWKHQWPECDSIPECVELIEMIQLQVDRVKGFRRNFVIFMVSTCLCGKKSGELCYLDYVVFKLRSVPRQLSTLKGWINDEIKYRAQQESVTGFGSRYLKDTLDKMSITDEEE